MMPIREVRITAYRGIRAEIVLPLDGKSILLHGDNGTGKSSIVRALQWALRGEEAPTGDAPYTSDGSFRCHILEKPDAPRVIITMTNGATIDVSLAALSVTKDAASYRRGCMEANPFLQRTRLLAFLQERPIDRFRYLESFLDLEQADRIREATQKRADAVQEQSRGWKEKRERLLTRINNLLPASSRVLVPTHDALLRATASLADKLSLPRADGSIGEWTWSSLFVAAMQAEVLLTDKSVPLRRATLVSVGERLTQLSSTIDILSDFEEAEAERRKALAAATDSADVALLEHARRHLTDTASASSCPVCGQGIDRQKILTSLAARLNDLADLKAATQRRDAVAQEWFDVWRQLSATARDVAKALGKGSLKEVEGCPSAPASSEPLHAAQGVGPFADTLHVVGASVVKAWIANLVSFAKATVTAQIAVLPAESSTGDLSLLVAATKEAETSGAEIELLTRQHQDAEVLAKRLASIANAVRKARQDVAKKLLEEISEAVETFYRRIHPRDAEGEVTDAPAIDIQRTKGGLAFVRGTFNQRRVDDPQLVYSDGHLDTVGICVFLALRKFRSKKANDPRLIVLDDIVLSVDFAHARRLLDVLNEHFKDHQIILLTHSGLFARWCTSRLPGLRRHEIRGWSLESGPKLGDYTSRTQALELTIAQAATAKEIGLAAMSLMDEFLLEARYIYALSVPAKRGEEYTLTEIWEHFVKALRATQKALKEPIGDLSERFDRLSDLPRVRNSLAAHENEFAQDFPLATMRQIGQDCIAIVRLLYCAECDGLGTPQPSRHDPATLMCSCTRLRYVRPIPQDAA